MAKKEVKFVFDNEKTAKHFIRWLCGSGEQHYWNWMESRESEESGDITATKFDYWNGTKDGAQFGKGKIVATSGRLTDDFDDEDEV